MLREQYKFSREVKNDKKGESLEYELSKVLFNDRVTPESTTIKSPAKLICKRKLKSQLNLLHPYLQGKIESKVKKQKEAYDREEDTVFTRNYRTTSKWIEGTVSNRLGPVSYL